MSWETVAEASHGDCVENRIMETDRSKSRSLLNTGAVTPLHECAAADAARAPAWQIPSSCLVVGLTCCRKTAASLAGSCQHCLLVCLVVPAGASLQFPGTHSRFRTVDCTVRKVKSLSVTRNTTAINHTTSWQAR